MVVPCASRIELHDGSILGGHDQCEWDREEITKYVGVSFNLYAFFNQQEFDDQEFSDESRIVRNSLIFASYTTTERAVWTESLIELNELVDETDIF